MMERIPGHDRWLNPPNARAHRMDCPAFYDEDEDCQCKELCQADADIDAEDRAMEEYYRGR